MACKVLFTCPESQIQMGKAVTRFDQYVFLRCLMYLALLSGILVGINWINLAVRALDNLVSSGQSPLSILEYLLLLLPLSASNAVPLSFLAAATYLVYRMQADGEVTALKNTGMSPARLILPYFAIGMTGALLSALLVHILIPIGEFRTDELNAKIRDNLASKHIRKGQFYFPLDGLAVFVADGGGSSALQNVFIHDARDRSRERTYFARSASLTSFNREPVLELQSGLIEQWSPDLGELEAVSFDSLRFNLASLSPPRAVLVSRVDSVTSMELVAMLRGSDAAGEQAAARPLALELHDRIIKTLRSLVYPLMGVSAVLLADRLGVRLRLVLTPAILSVVVIHVLGDYLEEAAHKDLVPVAVMYAHMLLALLAVVAALLVACIPRIRPLRSAYVARNQR